MAACRDLIDERRATLPSGIKDDAACALTLYTAWADPPEAAYCAKLDARLCDTLAPGGLAPFAPMLRLALDAMSKAPPVVGVVWRGVAGNLSSQFTFGSKVTCPSFLSTVLSMDALEDDREAPRVLQS